MFRTALLCFLSLAAAPAPAREPQTSKPLPATDEIIARHIRATGGKAAWAKWTTQTRKGIALPGVANYTVETWAQAPGKWAFVLTLGGGRVLKHGFDGAAGWQHDSGAPKPMSRDQALEETLIYDSYLTLHLTDLFPKMTVKAVERNGGRRVYAIEAVPAEGRAKTLWFDIESGLLVRAGKVVYDEYRDAGGVKAPFLIRYGWQTFEFSEIRHGAPVDEARFRMPAPPAAPPEAVRASAAIPAEPLPSAAEVVDKYLKAIGGVAAAGKLTSQTRKGVLREGDESYAAETCAKAPDKWLFAIHISANAVEKNGFDGNSAWVLSGDLVKDMQDGGDREDIESFVPLDLPAMAPRFREHMTVRAKETRGTHEFYIVEAAPPQGRRYTLAFDAETGLLSQVGRVALEDYREVDGVKVPFTVKLHGGHFVLTFTEIKNGEPIDDARFRRPAPGPGFEKAFAALDNPRAVAVLRRAFGQGVAPSDGRYLYDLIVEKGYKCALDIGTARGYSSLWLALAMTKNGGKVVTIEIDPEVADEARANFREAGLDRIIDSRVNDALREVPLLEEAVDFVFMDPGAPINKTLFDMVYPKLGPGGAITAHNASGFKSSQPDFLKAIEGDPNLATKILETASGGMSVSIRKQQ